MTSKSVVLMGCGFLIGFGVGVLLALTTVTPAPTQLEIESGIRCIGTVHGYRCYIAEGTK
jgi:hypothetical protein